ncbi:unnamed protein product [Rotaria sordida]|uniref:Tr-type G domain-containing protein n=1 Tax=Rotaria sordida TaxID=392033 RepID=A0A819X106_9BILA|nr:unnamed protein product [Rotaria sordida]CAF4134984.1 unnamed protein product [Rotaria sordida]
MEEDFSTREGNQFIDDDDDRVMDDSTAITILTTTINKTNIATKPVNIGFCGHADAGKSTIGEQLMFLTVQVDKRTLEKYQNKAREKSRES